MEVETWKRSVELAATAIEKRKKGKKPKAGPSCIQQLRSLAAVAN
jgi:hypothetical protein